MAEMGLYEAMSTLRAVRRLKPDPIPDAVLRRVVQAAAWAPTGGNAQPWRVVLVRDAALRGGLGELYREPWARYAAMLAQGDRGAAGRAARGHRAHARGGRLPGRALPRGAGDRGVLLQPGAAWRSPTRVSIGRRVVGGGSVYPSVQNFLLAARAEGLGCVLTTLLCQREAQVKALLGIPAGVGHLRGGAARLSAAARPRAALAPADREARLRGSLGRRVQVSALETALARQPRVRARPLADAARAARRPLARARTGPAPVRQARRLHRARVRREQGAQARVPGRRGARERRRHADHDRRRAVQPRAPDRGRRREARPALRAGPAAHGRRARSRLRGEREPAARRRGSARACRSSIAPPTSSARSREIQARASARGGKAVVHPGRRLEPDRLPRLRAGRARARGHSSNASGCDSTRSCSRSRPAARSRGCWSGSRRSASRSR